MPPLVGLVGLVDFVFIRVRGSVSRLSSSARRLSPMRRPISCLAVLLQVGIRHVGGHGEGKMVIGEGSEIRGWGEGMGEGRAGGDSRYRLQRKLFMETRCKKKRSFRNVDVIFSAGSGAGCEASH